MNQIIESVLVSIPLLEIGFGILVLVFGFLAVGFVFNIISACVKGAARAAVENAKDTENILDNHKASMRKGPADPSFFYGTVPGTPEYKALHWNDHTGSSSV